MNVYLPQFRALHLAENANPSMHNLLPPRGALVRDAKAWADYLTQALSLYGGRTDVVLTGHGWPRWGAAEIAEDLGRHRDAYKYLHDQSVRLMNQGLTGAEIAERLRLPPALKSVWINQDFYGTLATNARAVYQRYMGWYDANPASLNPLQPVDAARRYVGLMGGPAGVLAEGRRAFDAGEYRWAAEVLNRMVFAAPDHAEARELLARTYTQMAYQSESGQVRNLYLTGAHELRTGAPKIPGGNVQADVLRNAPTAMLLDLLAVRLNGERAADVPIALQLVFPDVKERHYLTVRNGVLVHEPIAAPGALDATVTLDRPAFYDVILGRARLAEKVMAKQATVVGDAGALDRLVGLLDTFEGGFAVVTP
jgi:alkyl sulfatase BDS1-like metallo-beta-lactamase superfamily hydrolase